MPDPKVKVMTIHGEKDGTLVQVEEATERWSEVTLTDGTVFKIKATIVSAIRPDDQYDPTGNPMYVLNITPTVIISSIPDELKKQVS